MPPTTKVIKQSQRQQPSKKKKNGPKISSKLHLNALVRAKLPRAEPAVREALRTALVQMLERLVKDAHTISKHDGLERVTPSVAERAVRNMCRAPEVQNVISEALRRYNTLNE